jgi:hypothetical protein
MTFIASFLIISLIVQTVKWGATHERALALKHTHTHTYTDMINLRFLNSPMKEDRNNFRRFVMPRVAATGLQAINATIDVR